jgi:hypothetical protein
MNKISIIKKKLKQGIDYPAYKRSSIADLRFQLRITEVPSFVNQEKKKTRRRSTSTWWYGT